MKVLVFERNLLWSARLVRSLRSLGHEAEVREDAREDERADAAIVNLGEGDASETIACLRRLGIPTIGHAGHKERELHEMGREAGCDILATNGELTYKIERLLERLP